MANIDACPFCNFEELEWRTIRDNDVCVSFVSSPWFRQGHCLVVPRRHLIRPVELTPEEGAAVMGELGRLSARLDEKFGGFGSGIMQKYQPTQADNGVKMSHLHWHVFPRLAEEVGLFPTPIPNNFEGFEVPLRGDVAVLAHELA